MHVFFHAGLQRPDERYHRVWERAMFSKPAMPDLLYLRSDHNFLLWLRKSLQFFSRLPEKRIRWFVLDYQTNLYLLSCRHYEHEYPVPLRIPFDSIVDAS